MAAARPTRCDRRGQRQARTERRASCVESAVVFVRAASFRLKPGRISSLRPAFADQVRTNRRPRFIHHAGRSSLVHVSDFASAPVQSQQSDSSHWPLEFAPPPGTVGASNPAPEGLESDFVACLAGWISLFSSLCLSATVSWRWAGWGALCEFHALLRRVCLLRGPRDRRRSLRLSQACLLPILFAVKARDSLPGTNWPRRRGCHLPRSPRTWRALLNGPCAHGQSASDLAVILASNFLPIKAKQCGRFVNGISTGKTPGE